MNKTPNYSLNQWEAEDRVLRTDFNADNAKIDAAIAALASGKADAAALTEAAGRIPVIRTGTYTGTGANGRVISLGFRPRAVLTVQEGWLFNESGSVATVPHGSLAVDEGQNYSSNPYLKIADNGFVVMEYGTNEARKTYLYLAIG